MHIRNEYRCAGNCGINRLSQREEFTHDPTLLKKVCVAVREGVTVENCCELFGAVDQLSGQSDSEMLTTEAAYQGQENMEVNNETANEEQA